MLVSRLRWVSSAPLVYVVAVLAAVHFIWRVKSDLSQPLTYAAVLVLLFFVRIRHAVQTRKLKRAAGAQA